MEFWNVIILSKIILVSIVIILRRPSKKVSYSGFEFSFSSGLCAIVGYYRIVIIWEEPESSNKLSWQLWFQYLGSYE